MLVGMQRTRVALVAVASVAVTALGGGVASAAAAPDLLAVTGCRSAGAIRADLRAGRDPLEEDVRTTANSLATSTTPGARSVGMALFYAQMNDQKLGVAVRKVVRWCRARGIATTTTSTTTATAATG